MYESDDTIVARNLTANRVRVVGYNPRLVDLHTSALKAQQQRAPVSLVDISIECGDPCAWRVVEACESVDTVRFGRLAAPSIPPGYRNPRHPGAAVRSWEDCTPENSVVAFADTLTRLGAAGVIDLATIEHVVGVQVVEHGAGIESGAGAETDGSNGEHMRAAAIDAGHTGGCLGIWRHGVSMADATAALDAMLAALTRLRSITIMDPHDRIVGSECATPLAMCAHINTKRPEIAVRVVDGTQG